MRFNDIFTAEWRNLGGLQVVFFSDNGQTPYSPYSHSIHYIAGDPEGGFPAARDPPKSRSWSTTDYVSDL